MRPLRIAMVSHAYPYLERIHAGQFVHELASTLVRLGHQVYAVVPSPSEVCEDIMDGVRLEFYRAQDRVSYGRADDAYVKQPRLAVMLSLGHAVRKLHQVVRERDVDVIHAHWAVPMGFVTSLVSLVTGVPLVITTHGRDVYVDEENGDIIPTLWYIRPFLRFALRRADRVVAVSQDCRDHAIRAGAPADGIAVLHNGVNLKRFSPVPGTADIREQLGLGREDKLILFVGTLANRKGVDVLIRALPEILLCEPQSRLMIVGDGVEKPALIRLRDSLGLERAVVFAGTIPNTDIPQYENACDLLVMPSRREPFGIAAIEAMACAKPVVGTRVGGLKEVIDDGETGLLVEPDHAAELASAVLRVLSDDALAKRLGNNARRKVEAEFDWAGVGRRTAALYGQVLGDAVSRD